MWDFTSTQVRFHLDEIIFLHVNFSGVDVLVIWNWNKNKTKKKVTNESNISTYK